ncbi:muscular LMNA-interacting protein isoform X2 [Phyllopteryx taeniolatus]|uniref:muscular LMNA-interacting protein isoform X2 n=1 Tax=Phyllopteryx taeniolatus TaxID=161469 RepID=UPI002AD543FA|nr:muscular LMNA-interacting protein isoform X2 [Phyllopteryx taeniolatus]
MRSSIQSLTKSLAGSVEKTSSKTMSDGKILKAEIIYIKDSLEGGAGKETKKNELHSPLDRVSRSQTSTSLGGQSENTHKHSGTASMETTANKHRGLSQQWGHDSSGHVEVSSGFSTDKPPGLDGTTSPAYSAHVFPTPASSRESILSESWDRDKIWPAMSLYSVASPPSLSRTVSPCSSVRSGVFSPAVVQIRKHALAPGSSLVHIPQSCFSSCDSLASPVCPQSPLPPRHRPPLTRLSLLTAILRKGRLPVLSASLRRPYTPCWPVNPVTLTFCNACSAASSVASIPLEFSSPFSSSASLDSQTFAHREPNKSVTAPPPKLPNEHSRAQTSDKMCSGEICPRSVPKWEQFISPPPLKSTVLPSDAPPQLCSKLKSVSPNHKEVTLQHSYVLKPPELKPSFDHMHLSSKGERHLEKQMTHPPLFHQPATSGIEKSHQQNSSLSKLRLLSERLRSPSPCTPFSSPSHSRSASAATSPLPSLSVGRCKSPQAFPNALNLTPSRYTPVAFSGWSSPIGSPTPTPSPATLFRDLTPSPSFSLLSTPSPRPGSGISDCSDREGKKRKPHMIKSSYKSLAAIPTNTVLLDQQVIDEQVESENILKRGITSERADEDTHAEMCSPAQLRQQSEELYAAIDEILANSTPPSKTSSKISMTHISLQNNSAKSLGRETKYASLSSLHPSASVRRRLMDSKRTTPGVIRPTMTIPRLSEKDGEEYRHHPFGETDAHRCLKGKNACKTESVGFEDTGVNGHTSRKRQALQGERTSEIRSPFAMCELQIIEPEGQIGHFEVDPSTSLCSEACETHI